MTNTESSERDVALSRRDRARSLDMLHEVERQAGAAGPARPDEWRDDLLLSLDALASSLHDQFDRSSGEDGLLTRVVSDAAHLASSVEDLRRRQLELIAEIDDLRQSLSDLSRTIDVGDIRSRVRELTGEIRELRAWEVDIVYEAYSFDLGTGD